MCTTQCENLAQFINIAKEIETLPTKENTAL
jgi:hypothetical protein